MAIKKGNIKLTLSVNKTLLQKYKRYCEERGLVISKQVENFINEILEKRK
ncbi:MAG: hypothetical protein KJ646_04590 [Nanoarchaeota archaeon]|nr:hypothetical protein [Nanoarchaeota archaeon]MBU4116504.1 hypothetical protein [Nanoarchaeota archaeon]